MNANDLRRKFQSIHKDLYRSILIKNEKPFIIIQIGKSQAFWKGSTISHIWWCMCNYITLPQATFPSFSIHFLYCWRDIVMHTETKKKRKLFPFSQLLFFYSFIVLSTSKSEWEERKQKNSSYSFTCRHAINANAYIIV